jgi:hypothetical protein
MKTNKVTTFEGLGTITAPENLQADHEIHNRIEFITPPQAFVKRNLA